MRILDAQKEIRRTACAAAAAIAVMAIVPGGIIDAAAAPGPGAVCRVTIYYDSEEQTNIIGGRSTCPGAKKRWGKPSPYAEVELIEFGRDEPVGTGDGPGDLPCEFLDKGCPNLPEPHH